MLLATVSLLPAVKVTAAVLFVLPGILALVGAASGARWLTESRGASPFRRHFGQKGTRLFYGMLGLLLIGAGVVLFFDPLGRLS